ncbi:MAG: pyridoxal phosphate-dependent aminotransferase [Alloprevotella sp.]
MDNNQEERVRLDTNESPFNTPYNRFPGAALEQLKEAYGKREHIPPSCIYFCGNGTEQAADLCLRLFCLHGDLAVTAVPTRSVYRRRALASGVELQEVKLSEEADYRFECAAFMQRVHPRATLLFLCSPNCPTGRLLPVAELEALLARFKGWVVVDESYIDFTPQQTVLPLLGRHANLLLFRSFSRGWSAASLRVGVIVARPSVVSQIAGTGYTYPLSSMQIEEVQRHLRKISDVCKWQRALVEERGRMVSALRQLPACTKVYDSAANFLLVRFADNEAVERALRQRGIRVKRYPEGLRITIGLPADNAALLAVLRG